MNVPVVSLKLKFGLLALGGEEKLACVRLELNQ